MKIHRVHHGAVLRIFECQLNRIALPDANKRPGHLAIEGPVTIRCAGCGVEHADQFLGSESYSHHCGWAAADRRRKVGWIAYYVGSFDGLRAVAERGTVLCR